MGDENYVRKLENVIKQMLQPLKDIPFNLVIEAMTGKKVISFDFSNQDHKEVLELLKKAAINAGKEINKTGILRPRPNEVGNDIEPYVRRALNDLGLNADIPIGRLQEAVKSLPNDYAKYFVPECLKTRLIMSSSSKALYNFFKLRLDKKTHPEIRELCVIIFLTT